MDYKIHFKNLEEDFYTRVIQEDRRKKQEDVKMRVLGDPRITYEQYSEMLQGAHLKPIKKGDHADISQGYKRKVTLTDYKNE